MTVFWQQFRQGSWQRNASDWRCYKGRAKWRGAMLEIYPTNGKRQRLSVFIAFDDAQPPNVFLMGGMANESLIHLSGVGEIAAHLPPMFIDRLGNIRRTDSTLSLVLMGPNWDEVKEAEYQDELALPF